MFVHCLLIFDDGIIQGLKDAASQRDRISPWLGTTAILSPLLMNSKIWI